MDFIMTFSCMNKMYFDGLYLLCYSLLSPDLTSPCTLLPFLFLRGILPTFFIFSAMVVQ